MGRFGIFAGIFEIKNGIFRKANTEAKAKVLHFCGFLKQKLHKVK
jgi:hypothetical protein